MTVTNEALLEEYMSLFEVDSLSLTEGVDPVTSGDTTTTSSNEPVTTEGSSETTIIGSGETTGTESTLTANGEFQVVGTKIYDPNGQEFIAKGTNVFTWDGTKRIDNYVDTWGFNTVRVPNYLLGTYGQPHPGDNGYYTNRKIVNDYTSRGVTVMFSAHDKIGSYYEGADFDTLKDYWVKMAQEFKDNPYVWFNLHNEPGNKTPQHDKWVNYHRELIDVIRAEGATNTIVIDGETWGQDYQTRTILNKADEVMADNENIVFSMHVYKQWGDGSEVGGYIDDLHAENIPILVGEYGNTNSTANMMTALQEREVGRIGWVAMAADHHDFTTGNKGHAWHYKGDNAEILTDLGSIVLDDLQRVEDLDQLGAAGSETSLTTGDLSVEDDVAVVTASRKEQIRIKAQSILLGADADLATVDINNTDQTTFVDGAYVTTLTNEDDAIFGLAVENDVIDGGMGHDVISGQGGDDHLIGGLGTDFLLGDEGNDTLDGGNDRDLLYGGSGTDYLIGGHGRDRFLLDEDGSVDTIADFQSSVDTILLSRGMTPDLLSYSQGVGEQAADTLIFDENNELFGILENFNVNRLKESDFRTI